MWGILETKNCFQRQSSAKCLRQTLVFMRNSEIRESFDFYLSAFFLLESTKFLFWEEDSALGYNSMKFWDFPNLSKFPKILSLKSFGNSWGNLYEPFLLLTIALRFTCGERKIGALKTMVKVDQSL